MLKSKKKCLLFLFLLLFVLVFGVSFVSAQRPLEVEYPTVPGVETPVTTKTALPDYIKYIFNFSIIIAGLIAFGALIYGGVRYLTSAGSPTVIANAKKQILAAFLGLIILLFSYLILTTISPQLVILQIPALEKFEPPPISEPIPLEQQTLYAEEIPTGKLIEGVGLEIEDGSDTSPYYEYEGVIAKTRLKRIIELSEKIWETATTVQKISEEISNASQKLTELVQQCICSNCTPVSGGCDDCSGWCKGEDVCGPAREGIRKQQAILGEKARELAPFKEKLEKLKEELELEKEKLQNALTELEKGEKMMKECPFSVGKGGKPTALLNFDSFWRYKEGLEKQKIVKKIEITKVWENISFEIDEAAFYCTEIPFAASLLEAVSEEELKEILEIKRGGGIEEPKAYCQEEIPFGEIIDNAEDISQRLVDEETGEMEKIKKEMEKIIKEIPEEVKNGEYLSPFSICSGNCSQWCECDFSPIWDCCERDKEGKCIDESNLCCFGCSLDRACEGNPCPGDKVVINDKKGKIQGSHGIITDAAKKITVSDDEVHNLIEGDEVHNPKLIGSLRKPTWAYNIINKELPAARKEFGKCVNSAEDWARAVSGEKILTKSIITCSEARDVCWNVEENYECYGEGNLESYPNYFCAEAETQQ